MTNKQASERLSNLDQDRAWLSAATGYSIHSLNNAFSGEERELKDRMDKAFERAFSEEERRREVDITKPGSSVWDLVYFNGLEVERIDRAKKVGGYSDLPSFYRDAVIDFADSLLRKEANPVNVTSISAPRANLQAAAGSPISAEVVDWNNGSDTVMVKVNGLSMDPLLADGEVIPVKLKHACRTPHMAKGEIYLVSYDGGMMMKRYNTRRATAEEIAEGVAYTSPSDGKPKVRILQSINKNFPEIVIKDEADWIGWYDQKARK